MIQLEQSENEIKDAKNLFKLGLDDSSYHFLKDINVNLC